MKPRKHPNDKQFLRRLRDGGGGHRDPRVQHDAYWALRSQGHPHSMAVRVHRDIPPHYYREKVSESNDYIADLDPADILFPDKTELRTLTVYVRPELTEEAVRVCAPREREYTIWDHAVPSFGVRIRPTGSKSFILMYRIKGQRSQAKLTIDRFGTISLNQARDIARACRTEALRGNDPRNKELLKKIWDNQL